VIRDAGFPIDAGASAFATSCESSNGLRVLRFSGIVMLASGEINGSVTCGGTIVVRDSAMAIPTLAALTADEAGSDDGLDRDDRVLIESYSRAPREPRPRGLGRTLRLRSRRASGRSCARRSIIWTTRA